MAASSAKFSSSEEDSLDTRPRKRPKTGSQNTDHGCPSYQQVVLEELDLEIALRQRLSDTVQSRITWALLLQQSLEGGFQDGAGESDFQTVALDALDAIEAPCSVLFTREVRLPPKPILNLPKLPPPPLLLAETPQHGPRAGSSRTRGLSRAAPLPIKKLLFLRNTSTDPPTIAKLACPDCARSDFSNLQGLLNHCRLRHHREYGSHDECMQSCAVLVPEQERGWVVANGTEVGGISLPSLRRLFEMAVGAGERLVIPGGPGAAAPQPSKNGPHTVEEVLEPAAGSSHVTRTLGHHIDTPALAPFLGRAPKKRRINVHGEDEVVDIFVSADERAVQKRRWCMPYNHRNIARAALDEVVSPLLTSKSSVEPDHNQTPADDPLRAVVQPPSALQSVTSRFHISARVTITDHSLWLHPEQRLALKQQNTHRWRLSVNSPSYSLPITTFLSKLTITCLTVPPPSTFVEPITVTDPPFVVTSTADKPFLARLTFTWAGSTNTPTDVEHWVELDPVHLAHPVAGDEQVFDVELDRNTELLPVRAAAHAVTWDDEQPPKPRARPRTDEPNQKDENATEPDYVARLRALLPQVPLTLRDTKARMAMRVPYFLASTPAHFRGLVPGRRKAIEMGRARALQGLYERLPQQEGDVPLTTADVYRWMLDEGLFPRTVRAGGAPEKKVAQKASGSPVPSAVSVSAGYCSTCGAHQTVHAVGPKDEFANDKTAPAPMMAVGGGLSACVAFRVGEEARWPLFDVQRLLSADGAREPPYALSATLFGPPAPSRAGPLPSSADLAAVADPHLTTAIGTLATKWKLDHLAPPAALGPRQETVDSLAPYALLAAATKSFVRLLLRRGVDAFRRDEAGARVLSRYRRGSGGGGWAGPARLLTPGHVVRGVTSHAQGAETDAAAVLALSRLGESSQDARVPGPASRAVGVAVKMEVEEV